MSSAEIINGKIKRRVPENILNPQEIALLNESAPKVYFTGHLILFDVHEPKEEFYLEKAKMDLRETPEMIVQGCKELKEYIEGDPDLVVPDEEYFYKQFLRPCKYYPKSAFSLMQRHYRFKKNYPKIVSNLVPSKEKALMEAGLVYPLPLRNRDGSRIIVVEAGKRWKPKEFTLDQLFRVLMMLMHVAISEPKTQIAGARVIIDMEGLSLSQVTYFTPSFAKMVVEFTQKCLPSRLKSIHIVNQSFLFNMVFAIFKQFLEEKIRKRIHFHGTNWDSLRTFIDKCAVTKRHGGELDVPDEAYFTPLWELFCHFEQSYKDLTQIGYVTEVDKK